VTETSTSAKAVKHPKPCGGQGGVLVDSLTITKKIDKATPKLFMAAATGSALPSVTLTFYKSDAGGQPALYLSIVLSNAFVSAIDNGGASSSGDLPTENVSFSFAKVAVTYVPQATPGVTPGATTASWNVCDR